MVLEFPFGLQKFRAFTVEEEEEKKRERRRREEEKKKKKKEEGRRKMEEEKFKNLRYGIGLWIIFIEFVYGKCVWNFSIELFGLAVVLNGGKFCIEKMLGFRGDAVHFFKTHVFVLSIT